MARKVREGPRVSVGHDGIAQIAVYWEDLPGDDHWAGLMYDEGPPPGSADLVEVSRDTVTMAVPVGKVRDALDWLAEAVERTTAQWERDEERRRAAEEEVEQAARQWWQAQP